ncbi:putative disease resistance RPP13-like protein 1 [Rosa rugosa]|uniref:putative disease resistance RPP13-like protein 1 n=1 Tax=Rosa rugosa TaxID=74645 RepID=UPI002B40DB5D|nr:putative disease resistance RPP13-like protein 1 [Rosa rugosa]
MESPPEVVDSFSAGTRERVKDPSLEQKLSQVADEHGILPYHLKRLFLYCSLFPFGYEFRKDELVQLWIAEGFIRERYGERMEDTAGEHFNSLEKEGFFVFSRCDFTVDFDSVLWAPADNPSNFLYKVNPIKHSLLEDTISSGNYFKSVDGKLDGASKMTRHLSLIGEDMDGMAFGILQNFKHLRTLHMLSCRGSSMKHVPRDLCFTLTFLKTLNLSGTLISELPSSIGNVKSLRYVDASRTPISRLPESIDSLYNLQTIKLRGCFHFVQLPKGTKKLKKLRHIDLDIIRQLDSMPAHLGSLSNLQTLPAFLVGRDDGCRVGELKNLNDLKGSFNISRLENVLSEEEAEEAALIEKKCIHRLELRWSDMFVEYSQQEKILECLQPHSGLKELQIQQYSGSILPTWISNPSFIDLVVITLHRCRNCKLLPCMGQLPALKSLSIIEVNEVKEINHQFFRKGLVDHAFPKLEILEVDSMLSLKRWKDVQVGDLPSLVKLTLDSCPELVTLPALLCLKSLKHLELRCCPKLMALPTGGLPTSLEFFLLLDCLELKIWCLKIEHWSMLCHVPSIWFDHEEIKGRCGMTDQLALARVGAVAAEARTYTRISTEYSSSLSAAPAPSLPQLPAFNSRTMEPQDMPSKVLHSVKVVLKVDLLDVKSEKKVLRAVTGLKGVGSASLDLKDKKLTVIGDVDPVKLVSKLRKLCHAELLSVGPVKEQKKKEEPKKEEPQKEGEKKNDPKDEVAELLKAYSSYNPPTSTSYYVRNVDEDPNACVIC